MNVCLVTREYPPETGGGGIGTYTYHLAHGFSARGQVVTVISHAPAGETVETRDRGVVVWRIPDPVPRVWSKRVRALVYGRGYDRLWLRSRAVFEHIRTLESAEQPFDVIEAPLWDGEGAAHSARFTMAPLVVRLQTPIFVSAAIVPIPTRRAAERLERRSLRKATLIAAISRANGVLVARRYGIDPARIREAPLGIEMPAGRAHEVDGTSARLLYVGRLEQRKGTQELIDALPRILGEDQNITVDIVGQDTGQAPGGGSYKTYFEHKVPRPLQSRVRFHGFVPKDELARFYRDCDLFVAPSRYESFGLIYLEAMACGKPVIGTRTGGIPEVVTEEVGRLVAPEAPAEIAEAVLALMKDRDLRRTLGRAAYRRASEHFSTGAMVDRTLALYDEAIALHRACAPPTRSTSIS